MNERRCKGCSDDYQVTEERIDKLLASPMFQAGAEAIVPDDIYEERLKRCRACPNLVGGHTCTLCGCYVRVRAKFKDKSCPAPIGGAWAQ